MPSGQSIEAEEIEIRREDGTRGVVRFTAVPVRQANGAVQAAAQGADFVVLGPIYETPSKREYGPPLGLEVLGLACRRVHIPVFAIGGITIARAREAVNAGAFGVAVMSSILAAPDAAAATRGFLSIIDRPNE